MMEKATSSLRRSGAFLLSLGSGYQELNLIISDLSSLKSKIKANRDTQQTVLQEIWTWTNAHDNRALNEMFAHLTELYKLWAEVQTQFAEQIGDFKHQFEMFLEGEKNLDAARNELSDCEVAEAKAEKKFKKLEKKKASEEFKVAATKLEECKKQKQLMQIAVSEKVLENEAVKLIRLKNGLLKLSEAFITVSQKCIYVFEAQRDIVKALPDVEDKEIHEMKFDGLPGAENIVQRARTLVSEYRVAQQSALPQSMDPPPAYGDSFYSNPPFNPYYYANANAVPNNPISHSSQESGSLYPRVGCDEELTQAMNAAKI